MNLAGSVDATQKPAEMPGEHNDDKAQQFQRDAESEWLLQLNFLRTSGAVQNSEGIRAALGLAPSCYTGVAPFLFRRKRLSIPFARGTKIN